MEVKGFGGRRREKKILGKRDAIFVLSTNYFIQKKGETWMNDGT